MFLKEGATRFSILIGKAVWSEFFIETGKGNDTGEGKNHPYSGKDGGVRKTRIIEGTSVKRQNRDPRQLERKKERGPRERMIPGAIQEGGKKR